jgi:hypothetical protein
MKCKYCTSVEEHIRKHHAIASNDYCSGIQIPISVIVFGIFGGYLRFLFSSSTNESRGETMEQPFFESLKDLALFFLVLLLVVAL